MRRLLLLFACLFAGLTATAQSAITYSNVAVFGDSLSDTGNVYATALALGVPYPGPLFNYTTGRFTDGLDTKPPARAYFGVWHEQVDAMLPGLAVANPSLGSTPGTNYAFGDATTQDGTTPKTVSGYTVQIRNMGQQVTDYLAAHHPGSTSLMVLFGGANDFLQNPSTSPVTVASRITALVQKLVSAGASNFLILNLPALGDPTTQLGQDTIAFNTALAAGIATLQAQYALTSTPFHVTQVDLFSLYAAIAASPSTFGFTDLTTAADTLSATANPDTYLSWDGLHPTTAGHHWIATAACSALAQERTALTTSAAVATPSSPATLTATVSNTGTYGSPTQSATPTGTVSFYSDTTSNGTVQHTLLGTGTLNSSGVATLSSTAIPAGAYTISAVYSGDTHYTQGCRTSTVALTVSTPTPSFTLTLTPAQATVSAGSPAITQVSVTPAGGFTGNVTITCGSLPQYVTCAVANPVLNVTSSSNGGTATVTIGTSVATANTAAPDAPGPRRAAPILFALLILPAGFWSTRRRAFRLRLLASFCMLAAIAGLSGCGSYNSSVHHAGAGTYTIPIIGTAGSSSATANFTLTVQ